MKNISNKLAKAQLWLALPWLLLAVGCSDEWDDHYREEVHGEGSLWQALTADNNLSNFVAVLDACDYETTLNGTQVFTVFALNNQCFDTTQRDSVINLYKSEVEAGVKENYNRAIKEFVRNYIALYNYPISSLTNDSICMMNGKFKKLTSDYLGDARIEPTCMHTNNGILYTISSSAGYVPNVYEYLGRDPELSQMAKYIYDYSVQYFNASESVPGGINEDGQTVYLDSVTQMYNQLLSEWMEADINSEDSTYSILAPTNTVWDSLIAEYSTYFNYDQKVIGHDSMSYNFPRRAILEGTIFSEIMNPEKSRKDSIVSTNAVLFSLRKYYWGSYEKKFYQYDKPFEAGGAYADTKENIKCSNGTVYKTGNWNVSKYNTFVRTIEFEAESKSRQDSAFGTYTADLKTKEVDPSNPYYDLVSEHKYCYLEHKSSNNPAMLFNVPNVLSNMEYNVYIHMLPPMVDNSEIADSLNLPTTFFVSLICHDEEGKEVFISPKGVTKEVPANSKNLLKEKNYLLTLASTKAFETKANKVDTLFVGTWKIPTCSFNPIYKSTITPQVKLLIWGQPTISQVNAKKYVRDLRIDKIVFEPKR